MNNAEIILRALDERLDVSVELTLYGRAALQLGFDHPRAEFATSLDVDVVLWIGQAEQLLESGNFWDVVHTVNTKLAGQGLFISHFFEENQVILRPGWKTLRLPIKGAWRRLKLYRLANEDLFLTKLMRYDPLDLEDARFIREQSGWNVEDIEAIILSARIPPIDEISEQFTRCVDEVRKWFHI